MSEFVIELFFWQFSLNITNAIKFKNIQMKKKIQLYVGGSGY